MVKLYFKETEGAKFYSDSFVRKVLGESLNVNGINLVICKNKFGKPYLRDHPDVFYNISHTKGAIVCALASKSVGVDIERIKRFNSRIVRRFFTQKEQEYIFSDEKNQYKRFAEIWTMKEAYVKWIGRGMSLPFTSFDVVEKKTNLFNVFELKHYVVSVCAREPVNIKIIEMK